MKRLAIIASNEMKHLGGSEDLWIRTAGHLRPRGIEVHASLSHQAIGSPSLRRLDESATSHVFRRPAERQPFLRRRLQRAQPDPVRDWLGGIHPDLVLISQGGNLDGAAHAVLCRDLGLPYVLLSQAAGEWFPPYADNYDSARSAHAGAVRTCFVSESNRRLTEMQLAMSLPRACVVRNPYNVPYAAPPEWPDPKEGWKCALVGRLDAFCKGQDLLFRALGEPRWRDRPLSFSLFGSGPHEAPLRLLHRRWGLERVEFKGLVSDVRGIWETHHLLVLPSRQEGLPLALVEAMLCARPAVVTDVAGNTEVLRDGIDGFVAEAATPGFIGDALDRAWQRRLEWETMGQSARERICGMVPAHPEEEFGNALIRWANR